MSEDTHTDILSSIDEYKKKFNLFNSSKLKYLYASLASEEVRNQLGYISFLLHMNLPELPGHVQFEGMPAGIVGYEADSNMMGFIRSRHPSMAMPKGDKESFIQMFALMGSGGTVAFNKSSDFDFWVVADTHSVSREQIRNFKIKCKLIEEYYAENFDLEVHFFLNDISNVKKNIFDDDEEAGLEGTSLGYLLKEEFFRSSIVLYGKTPFWWVVPAGCSDDIYEQWLKTASGAGVGTDFVDLGNLYSIDREDFLIAALFQILKALGNPFKSIIKLGLLERYISDIDKNPFISNQIKEDVQKGELAPENIDAYIVMFSHVFQYYNGVIDDMTAANLIKTCFYLKINPMLSETAPSKVPDGIPDRISIMKSLTESWNWDLDTIKRIDHFDSWEIDASTRLLNNMKKFLLKGYKRILGSIDSSVAASRIHHDTLKSISRKIFSHFSPEPMKIDNSLSLKVFQPEKLLFIEFIKDHDGKEYWILGKKTISESTSSSTIIYKAGNLLNLIAWTSLHGLYKKNFTRLNLSAGYLAVDTSFIQNLLDELNNNFAIKNIELSNAYFLQDAFPVSAYIIINMHSKDARRINNMFFLFHNSWGETRFEEYGRENELPHLITILINSALRTGRDFERTLRIISSSPYNRSQDYKKLKLMLKNIFDFFVNEESYNKRRYITMIGNSYYLFSNKKIRSNIITGYKVCETELKLFYSIAYNRGVKMQVQADESIPELNLIDTITKNFRDDSVQIYFQAANKYMFYYVSDERGSIIYMRKIAQAHNDYMARLYNFAEKAVGQVLEYNPESSLAQSKKKVRVYSLNRDAQYQCSIEEINPEMEKSIFSRRGSIIPFRLSLHILEDGDVGYRFSLPDGGFSEIYNRTEVVGLANEIKILMESVPGYSFFVSDAFIEHAEIPMYRNNTSFAFSEKNRFELMIEKGLQKLSG